MKKIIKKVAIAILLLAGMVTAQAQNNIEIAVGIAQQNCGDVNYVVYTGSKAYEQARADAQKNCKNGLNPAMEYNGRNGARGSYIVIVETKYKRYDGCDHRAFGVGFGSNHEEALKYAKRRLSNRSGGWQERKHGYDVKLSTSY